MNQPLKSPSLSYNNQCSLPGQQSIGLLLVVAGVSGGAAATHERAVSTTPAKATSRNGHTAQLMDAKNDATPALVPAAMHATCVA